MPPIHSYTCKAGHVTEDLHLIDVRPEHIKCRTCGKRARFVILKAPAGIVKNPAAGPRKGK